MYISFYGFMDLIRYIRQSKRIKKALEINLQNSGNIVMGS